MIRMLLALVFLALLPLHAGALTYWIEPCPEARSACQPGDPELAHWGFETWQNASAGKLEFRAAGNRDAADIRVVWASAESGLYGEARRVTINGHRTTEVYVRPAPLETADPLLRDAIVYLTCVHETGHALGLVHTADFADIMYSFQYGGNIPEYFNRYRRRLKSRADIRKASPLSEADRTQLTAR